MSQEDKAASPMELAKELEERETAAEEWAAYNMNSLPSGAPIRKHEEISA